MLPPEGVTDAVPVVPMQALGVEPAVTEKLPLPVTVTAKDCEHPEASVTVTVYVPDESPVAVEVVCPPDAQEYV